MKLAIRNENGQWWTGACWGVLEAREKYNKIEDLPDELPADNTDDTMIDKHIYNNVYGENLEIEYGDQVKVRLIY